MQLSSCRSGEASLGRVGPCRDAGEVMWAGTGHWQQTQAHPAKPAPPRPARPSQARPRPRPGPAGCPKHGRRVPSTLAPLGPAGGGCLLPHSPNCRTHACLLLHIPFTARLTHHARRHHPRHHHHPSRPHHAHATGHHIAALPHGLIPVSPAAAPPPAAPATTATAAAPPSTAAQAAAHSPPGAAAVLPAAAGARLVALLLVRHTARAPVEVAAAQSVSRQVDGQQASFGGY